MSRWAQCIHALAGDPRPAAPNLTPAPNLASAPNLAATPPPLGKNIEELRALWQETDVKKAKDLATRIYNTLAAAAQLGIAALQV